MSWGRLDDRFCTHPKVLATSFEALGLFAVSLSYAAAYETDGELSDGAVVMLCRGNTALVDQLVSRGFWERAETGYKIHGFLDYNPSKAVLDQKRKETRNRVAKHRKRNAVTNTDVTRPKRRVTPGRVGTGRDPSSSSVPVLSSEGGLGGGFDAFWAAYPNKVGKQKAREAWDKTPTCIRHEIIAAVELQKGWERWRRDGGRYIPNPATWLHQGRWDDRPNEAPPKLMDDRSREAISTWMTRMRAKETQ